MLRAQRAGWLRARIVEADEGQPKYSSSPIVHGIGASTIGVTGDCVHAEIRQNEADAGIAPIGVDLVQPDWAALGTAFGGTGRHVSSAGELTAAVQQAQTAGGLQVIHLDQSTFAL